SSPSSSDFVKEGSRRLCREPESTCRAAGVREAFAGQAERYPGWCAPGAFRSREGSRSTLSIDKGCRISEDILVARTPLSQSATRPLARLREARRDGALPSGSPATERERASSS